MTRSAFKKLNSTATSEGIQAAVNELNDNFSVMSSAMASREVYLLLKNGVKVVVRNTEGDFLSEHIQVIDLDHTITNISYSSRNSGLRARSTCAG
jgi:type I site-specific restriction-modification system R (restriction) subunit